MSPNNQHNLNAKLPDQVDRVCILGGGTAGWMTAAGIAKYLDGLGTNVTLIESDQIGTIGVGEATLPHIRFFNSTLGIDEATFMQATKATFKLGIQFCDWGRIGDKYIHPFGVHGEPIEGIDFHHFWKKSCQLGSTHRLDDYSFPVVAAEQGKFTMPSAAAGFGYAYQFDSSLYAQFLREFALRHKVERREGKVVDSICNSQNGFIEAVRLEDGHLIEADLFIDCSGFKGVLIEETLHTGYESWEHWLPCNRAVAVPCASNGDLLPYTRATAREAGWQWRIPLQHRVGNGLVYWNEYMSDEDAANALLENLEGKPLADVNQLYFKTGKRRKLWNKNVVSIGLSGGFLEPLESTSIHLIQEGITALIELFPNKHFDRSDQQEYNRKMDLNFERIRDFLLLHYVATERDDSEMWRYFRNMKLPDSLQTKIDAWQSRGYLLAYQFGVFLPASWIAVMAGQNLIPKHYDPRVDKIDSDAMLSQMNQLRQSYDSLVQRSTDHLSFLRSYGAIAGASSS